MKPKHCSLALGFALGLGLIFSSCHYRRHADKIFYNGKIYMVDAGFNVSEAFAIDRGRIKSIGLNEDILDDFDAPEVVDLKGAPVFPGFIDAHCHFYGYATGLLKCDLTGTRSYQEVVERLSDFARNNKFSWLLGRGWDQNDWDSKDYPTKDLLDSLFPNIPVFLQRVDGHAALCNSRALAEGKVNANTKVSGGEILMWDNQPSGVLIDNAMSLVETKIPPFSPDILWPALQKAQENCFGVGLTTVDDCGVGKDTISAMLNMQGAGKLKLRIYAMISDDAETMKYFFRHGPLKSERMTVRAVKLYADGSLGSRGACLRKEYSDMPGHYGFMLHDIGYYDRIADEAMSAGFQVCTHAIGDSAAREIIKIYEDHLTTDNNRRWRLEHCQFMEPKERKLMGEYSIIPSVQPTHATSDMYWAEKRLGPERIKLAYAYEDLRDACEGMIVFGTDFPVENISPIFTFYAAVVRKDLNGEPKEGFQPENKIKRKDAIKAMTIDAAFSNFEDEDKGSLEEGKYADFIILSRDLMKCDEEDIPKTKVVGTYIGGEKVW